jgi:hypothetical protein
VVLEAVVGYQEEYWEEYPVVPEAVVGYQEEHSEEYTVGLDNQTCCL